MSSLRVIKAGLFCSIQDAGRFGLESYGVPNSGVLDEISALQANVLVGNSSEEPVIESSLFGSEFEVLAERCVIAVTGGAQIEVNGLPTKTYSPILLKKGDIITVGSITLGARSYLAISGGIQLSRTLGSCSTLFRAQIGGINGKQLTDNTLIERRLEGCYRHPDYSNDWSKPFLDSGPFRVLLGPQAEAFDKQQIDEFLSSEFTISANSDRMALSLSGPFINNSSSSMITDATVNGAIQITSSGTPLILLKDRQTTGGYPKIAIVIKRDWSRLGQLKPGDKVRFSLVSVSEAHDLLDSYIEMVEGEISAYKDYCAQTTFNEWY